MLDTIVSAAIDQAERDHSFAVACASSGRVARRKRTRADEEPIPGTKQPVAALFNLLRNGWLTLNGNGIAHPELTQTPTVRVTDIGVGFIWPSISVAVGPDRIDAILKCGGHDLEVLVKRDVAAFQRLHDAMSGKPIVMGDKSITLPKSAPLPTFKLKGDRIEVRWNPKASASKGGRTAEFTGLDVYADFAEVLIEYRIFGWDVAKNPLVRFGD